MIFLKNEISFESTLVQIIEIGFVEDEKLWKSADEKDDERPYGNFTIDTEKGIYYAFTMRDNVQSTRCFSFDLPKVAQGEMFEKYNAKKVVLHASDIRDYFDCNYHHFIRGACCNKGKIYSLEGFTDSLDNPPSIRIIDTKLKKRYILKSLRILGQI